MSKQSAYFRVTELSDRDSAILKQSLDSIHGVLSVSVNVSSNKVAVDYDSSGTNHEDIKAKIEKTGYHAQLLKNQDHIM